jgi:hypothetical protein
VNAEGLPRAIRLRRGAQAAGGLLGPGLAGLALASGGVPMAMALNVALWALSAAATLGLRPSIGPAGKAPSSDWLVDSLGMAALGASAWPPGLVASFALIGLCMSVTQLIGQTHRALAVPALFRARMAAGQLMVAQLAGALAPGVARLLLMRWEVSTVYLVSALAFVCSGLLLLAVQDLRPFLLLDHDQARDWYACKYPEVFSQPVRRGKPGLRFACWRRRSGPLRSPAPATSQTSTNDMAAAETQTRRGAHKNREPPSHDTQPDCCREPGLGQQRGSPR